MATLYISSSTLRFKFLIINFLIFANPMSSQTLTTDNIPNFDPQIAVLGDAEISGDGVQVTSPSAPSSGLLLYIHPFKFVALNPAKTTSFSTELSFSFTGNGNALSLLMGPSNFVSEFLGRGQFAVLSEKNYLGVEFGAKSGGNARNSNEILVSVSVGNESSMHFVTSSGEKLKSWIGYDASSKRLEVRLSKLGDKRPYNPIFACAIDLSRMWVDNDVFVGLGSSNGKSLETCSVYSWKFRVRKFPSWMHSLPADPRGSTDNRDNKDLAVHKKSFCPLTILAGLIFATGCGALLAFMMLFAWAIFTSRRTVFPVEGNVRSGDFRYEKISVAVEKDAKVVMT